MSCVLVLLCVVYVVTQSVDATATPNYLRHIQHIISVNTAWESSCRETEWPLIRKIIPHIYDEGTKCLLKSPDNSSTDHTCYTPIVVQATPILQQLASNSALCEDILLEQIVDYIQNWLELDSDEKVATVTLFISQPLDENTLDFLLLYQNTERNEENTCHADDVIHLEDMILKFHRTGKKCLALVDQEDQIACYNKKISSITNGFEHFANSSKANKCPDQHFTNSMNMLNAWKNMSEDAKFRALHRFSMQECANMTVSFVEIRRVKEEGKRPRRKGRHSSRSPAPAIAPE